MFQGCERRLVNVEIQIQKAHYQLTIFLQVLRDRLRGVAANQFHFRNVPDESVHIEQFNAVLEVIV